MTDFLRLSHWDAQAVHEHASGYRVDATYDRQPACCAKCGAVDQLYRHGTLAQALNDTTHIRGVW